MKSVLNIFYLSGILFVLSCNLTDDDNKGINTDAGTNSTTEKTNVKIIDSTFNFGQIREGEKITFSYRFQNKGKKPLMISSVIADCGCTVAEKPVDEIKPGKSGYIKVAFDSDGIGGTIRKAIHVVSNAEPAFPDLILEGEVISN